MQGMLGPVPCDYCLCLLLDARGVARKVPRWLFPPGTADSPVAFPGFYGLLGCATAALHTCCLPPPKCLLGTSKIHSALAFWR